MQYTRTSGTGPLRLTLVKHVDVDHTFTAEITPDAVTLTHRLSTGEITHWQKRLSELGITPNQSIYIDFENVDYGVTLRLNGKDAFQRMDYDPNVDWLKDQYFNHPRDRGRPGEAFIEADQQKCTLDHLGLWRDVYYTNRGNQLHTGMPENPVQLAQGEFFVMGDNSAISKDARYWDQPIVLPHEGLDMPEGRVPEQFMLGKAVFVYWPAGYRLTDAVWTIDPPSRSPWATRPGSGRR
jgi:signal peptidase I